MLFSVVGNKTDTLVVLCTRDILKRPWCVGEMTTACVRNVDTILIIFPEFQPPSDAFIENHLSHIEGVRSLAPYGIDVEMVQRTLKWLATVPAVILPQKLCLDGVDAVVRKLVRRGRGRKEMVVVDGVQTVTNHREDVDEVATSSFAVVCTSPDGDQEIHETNVPHWESGLRSVTHTISSTNRQRSYMSVPVVSIVDHTTQESVCTAILLKEMLKPHCPLTGAGHVLGADEGLPDSTTIVLAVCSNGCFQKPFFVRQLFEAEARSLTVIPIVADSSFQFPCDVMFQELRQLSGFILKGSERTAPDLVALIGMLFEEIAVHVCPQDSQDVLDVRAKVIAKRLQTGGKALNLKNVSRTESHAPTSEAPDVFEDFDVDIFEEEEERIKL